MIRLRIGIALSVLLVLTILIGSPGLAQSGEEIIDPDNFKTEILNQLIFDKINQVRDSLNVPILKYDSILAMAAFNQAENIKETGVLSHTQKRKRFSTLQQRVDFYGGGFYTLAENVAYASPGPIITNGSEKRNTYNSYEKLATKLVSGWVNSSAHFKNLINSEYSLTGVAVTLDVKHHKVYAAQVFGSKGNSRYKSPKRKKRFRIF